MSCSFEYTAPALLSFRAPHWLFLSESAETSEDRCAPLLLDGFEVTSLLRRSWLSRSSGLAWPRSLSLFWQVFFAVANANLAVASAQGAAGGLSRFGGMRGPLLPSKLKSNT